MTEENLNNVIGAILIAVIFISMSTCTVLIAPEKIECQEYETTEQSEFE